MLSSLTGIPALFVRKKAKEYGTCRLAEGADVTGRRITLVEDIVTTGGAARDATHALRDAGAIVDTVICAIDRSPSPGEALTDVGLTTLTLLTRTDLDRVRSARPSRRWPVPLTCEETVDHDVTSFAGEGRCLTQYALLREPQALGNAPTACVVRGGLQLDTMQAERPERVIEDGRDSPGDQPPALEAGVEPVAHLR